VRALSLEIRSLPSSPSTSPEALPQRQFVSLACPFLQCARLLFAHLFSGLRCAGLSLETNRTFRVWDFGVSSISAIFFLTFVGGACVYATGHAQVQLPQRGDGSRKGNTTGADVIDGESAIAGKQNNQPSLASESPQPLTFITGQTVSAAESNERPLVLKEGHLTLRWYPDKQSRGYRVVDQTGTIFYEGRLPQGFVSGLVDGEYQFTVVSLDEQKMPMLSSQHPLRVIVQHHSLPMAGLIFSIGAAVMIALFVVMVIGGRRGEVL
jgi:hypothetical protein